MTELCFGVSGKNVSFQIFNQIINYRTCNTDILHFITLRVYTGAFKLSSSVSLHPNHAFILALLCEDFTEVYH